MAKKLGTRQRLALQWLVGNPWTTAWWGGRPYAGWPKEMTGATFDKLLDKKWVSKSVGARFDQTVSITAMGIKALAESKDLFKEES